MNLPRATVRLQLRNGVDFDAARATLDYHAALGISHLYLSPVLQAQAGSTHGYDTIAYDRVEPALGGEPGLRRLAEAAHARGMGLIVDFVPNHMGVGEDNTWWQDLQRWGRHSRYAGHFDIQWHTPQGAPLPLLLPVLDADYGAVLAERRFELAWREGEPFVCHDGQGHPLAPTTLPAILRQASLDAAAAGVERALGESGAGSDEARAGVRRALADRAVQSALSACWQRWAIHEPMQLDRLLCAQPYRLAHWRCADDDLNWRRFFNINGLAGLRVERDETYRAVHDTILRLHAGHVIDGLRIDHIDGLAAPASYCRRLRDDLQRQAGGRDTYLVVEKILGDGEALPASWPVDGTTGYDFMSEVGAVLHDDAGAEGLTRLYQQLCGDPLDFHAHQWRARRELLGSMFVCDLDMATARFHCLSRQAGASRDLALASQRRALAALAGAFEWYRSYLADGRARSLDDALPRAHASLPPHDRAALDFLAATMHRADADAATRAAVARFEQLTAPVAAKAVEDTAFYRYPRLLSRNEVGADPARIGISVEEFHRACIHRHTHWPAAMLATASHDHKLGEDARMRLAVLSECPRRWARQARRWMARWSALAGDGPDARELYMMLQMLVAVWPCDLAPGNTAGKHELAMRMQAWLTKALRESHRHTGWTCPDDAHEAAAAQRLDAFFADAAFLSEVTRFVHSIAAAGALSSLAQLTLRCTTPGVPDLYQGRELWDFSMVDPDNRRPIDFAAHAAQLDRTAPLASLLPTWHDGRIKQAWLARLLQRRARHPDLFLRGEYVPLQVEGTHRRHVIAFLRRHRGQLALVVVPRCPLRLLGRRSVPCIAGARWADTAIRRPADMDVRHFMALGSGKRMAIEDGSIPLSRLLDGVPAEVLTTIPS